jgi:hypothetical protein
MYNSCIECEISFISTSALMDHVRDVHRLTERPEHAACRSRTPDEEFALRERAQTATMRYREHDGPWSETTVYFIDSYRVGEATAYVPPF